MNILVTNDDGVHAPGIKALAEKLREVGEVTVVAPLREMSAVSHALTISAPLRFEHLEDRTFFVEGTPADCVNLAVGKLLPNPPDIVVSGINRGANVGDDIAYSGTVAGAREAAMLGVPSIAISFASKDEDADYRAAASFTVSASPAKDGATTGPKSRSASTRAHAFTTGSNKASAAGKKMGCRTSTHSEATTSLSRPSNSTSRNTKHSTSSCHGTSASTAPNNSTRGDSVFFCARLELGSHVPLE